MSGNDGRNNTNNNDYENLGGVYDFEDYYDEGYESDYNKDGVRQYDPYGQQTDPYAQPYPQNEQPRQSPGRDRSGQPRRSSSGAKHSSSQHHKSGGSSKKRPSNKKSSKKSSDRKRKNGVEYVNQYEYNENDLKPKKKAYSGKKSHPIRKTIKIIFIIILILFLLFNLLIWHYCGLVDRVDRGERTKTDASMYSDDVRNILIIGSDTRSAEERGRTDSMILLSINSKTKKIIMTSFMRDMYVMLPEYDLDGDGTYYSSGDRCKMNAAYVYGGAELLMDTIEYNFDIQVDDYIYIDFYSFVDIVDAIGGIEIEISDDEAEGMTAPMAEQNKIMEKPKGSDYLTHGGKLNLNGNQALAYARLRYVGNADFERTSRQRTVISKIIDKVKKGSLMTKADFASSAAESLRSNMSRWELFKLCYKAMFSMKYKIVSQRLPDDDSFYYDTTDDGQSVLGVDFEKCKDLLRKEIYGE